MLTKRKIQWLIGLMGAAVIGLLVFQWYWINNVLSLQNEQFDLKVTDALQEVVRKLEKQEVIYLTRQHAQAEVQKKYIESLGKSKVAINQNTLQQPIPEQYEALASLPQEIVINDFKSSDIFIPHIRPISDGQHNRINDLLRNRFYATPKIKELLSLQSVQEKAFGQWANDINNKAIGRNSALLHDVFKDLFLGERPIESRINVFLLDTLLQKAFRERGISIPFEYEVKNAKQQSVFSSVAFRQDTARSNVFKTSLFPNEITNRPSFLSVYFPDRQYFIIKNTQFSLATSALLLLVILGCFYVAVTTILKQKKLSDVKNDFINNMTHEFKTPISTVAMAVDMAAQQKDADKLLRYFNIIRSENQRLSGHVEKVLQMALLERGDLLLNKTQIYANNLIEKVIDTIGVQIEQKNGKVTLYLEAENDCIWADETHLTNVLHNLIDNANKYSPANPDIVIRTFNIANQLKISVEDKGLGMSQEQQSRIFEQFYRVPTGNLHDVKGFGLGLSYVKKIIDAHQGKIEVKSKLGQGTIFEVSMDQIIFSN